MLNSIQAEEGSLKKKQKNKNLYCLILLGENKIGEPTKFITYFKKIH